MEAYLLWKCCCFTVTYVFHFHQIWCQIEGMGYFTCINICGRKRAGRRGQVGSIPPLLKHTCGEGDWLLCWHYTLAKVSHQRWISWNIYYICFCQAQIRQNPLWLWNPEETSPEVQNRGISGPTNGHVSNKHFFKKQNKKTSVAGNLCNKCPSSYLNKTAVKVILSMRSLVSIKQQSPRRPCDITMVSRTHSLLQLVYHMISVVLITIFCGHFTYIHRNIMKVVKWIVNDPMEMFCSRHAFFLWPYMWSSSVKFKIRWLWLASQLPWKHDPQKS